MGTVAKSYHNKDNNSVIGYCGKHTIKQHRLQEELTKATLENAPHAGMLGAPEVLTLGENFIHLIGGKKALDNYKKFGLPIISKNKEVLDRIVTVEGPALDSLDFGIQNVSDRLIAEGQSGTFDFAFIDADKLNYTSYYDRAVTLLRKGGVIMIDNALWHGRVAEDPSTFDNNTKAIDDTNKKVHFTLIDFSSAFPILELNHIFQIFNDDRTYSALINIGDGTHIAFKK
ncbi:unnamed protein product [Cylicostephanus goldi]|uniref:Uncharacterized protein n=1 Tax=Cylicostephanus goldi TaxID=71465 RepID=A0A3P6REU2_CYLGO|nr:unnamed protein product [Cylicostephanus goldi]